LIKVKKSSTRKKGIDKAVLLSKTRFPNPRTVVSAGSMKRSTAESGTLWTLISLRPVNLEASVICSVGTEAVLETVVDMKLNPRTFIDLVRPDNSWMKMEKSDYVSTVAVSRVPAAGLNGPSPRVRTSVPASKICSRLQGTVSLPRNLPNIRKQLHRCFNVSPMVHGQMHDRRRMLEAGFALETGPQIRFSSHGPCPGAPHTPTSHR